MLAGLLCVACIILLLAAFLFWRFRREAAAQEGGQPLPQVLLHLWAWVRARWGQIREAVGQHGGRTLLRPILHLWTRLRAAWGQMRGVEAGNDNEGNAPDVEMNEMAHDSDEDG